MAILSVNHEVGLGKVLEVVQGELQTSSSNSKSVSVLFFFVCGGGNLLMIVFVFCSAGKRRDLFGASVGLWGDHKIWFVCTWWG